MKQTGGFSVVAAVLVAICLVGCGKEQQSAPPKSGDALQSHLLDILKSRHEAMLAGDLAKARSYNLPYANAKDKVFWELIGKSWDAAPTKEGLEMARTMPVLFAEGTPVELKQAGDWAYLRQTGGEWASHAYFLLQDGKWWVVKAYFGDAKPPTDDKFAYLRADTYWPDHIEDYFILPPVRLEIKPSAKPSTNTYFDWRMSLHVTNISEKTISSTALSRRFRSVQYVVGTSQSATEPVEGEQFRDLKPGETLYVGDVEIRNPEPKKSEVVFYVGPYVSNRLPTP